MINKIQNDINLLTPQFKLKLELFLAECNKQWYYPVIYETLRTKKRQIELYNQWRLTPWKIVTWTVYSNHIKWTAVDLVWRDPITKKITWNWPYDKIILIAQQFWINNLFPYETAHFEDNWIPYIINNPQPIMRDYTEVHNSIMIECNFKPIFDNFEDDKTTKQLINIWLARYDQRIRKEMINKININKI